MLLPASFSALCEKLQRFPGVGEKTARRMVFFILSQDSNWVRSFASSMTDLRDRVTSCSECGSITTEEICEVCTDVSRDRKTICVVEDQEDCVAMEQSGVYLGLYHVLGGRCSPLESQEIPKRSLDKLRDRIVSGGIQEVILALSPRVEGDMTAFTVAETLSDLDIKVTRLSYGLPVGGSISYSDSMTLHIALESRGEIQR